MRLSDFDYSLPKSAIADFPPIVRGTSRLLALNRTTGEISHHQYSDLINYLNQNDVLVLNDTKVIKARLIAKDVNNHDKEIFLLEKHSNKSDEQINEYLVLHRGTLHINDVLKINSTQLKVLEDFGNGIIKLKSDTDLNQLADTVGLVPLPPYITRSATPTDEERYQTIFAKTKGSVAAPTASLNMTNELLTQLRSKGVKICYLTLHVGLGTFLPIRTDDLSNHQMHSEFFIIPKDTVAAIQTAKETNHAVVALGTTVTRALEYAHDAVLNQFPHDISGEANIFIYPGYNFQVIDQLITNFHAPKSTVLMLTAAFAGWDKLKPAYTTAIQANYQLLSYGDSMIIY
jgi:S-adenosylmethionine:tRNA ribosyltransferase-isomerase